MTKAILVSVVCGAAAGYFLLLSLGICDALSVGSGFGWYSLAPVMLAEYSTTVSAVSFLHNIIRVLFSILLIPIVIKKIGHIEAISLPGATAMDICLPVVEKSTRGDIAAYSFMVGALLCIDVPIFVGTIAGV